MNMQMCDNGHFYDADVHAECPACKRPAEDMPFPKTGIVTDFPATGSYMTTQTEKENDYPKTSAVVGEAQEYPKTGPVGGDSVEFPKTGPVSGAAEEFPKTAPVSGTPQEFPKTMPVSGASQEFPKTEPIRSASQAFPKTAPVGAAGAFPKTMPIGVRGQVSTFAGRNPVLGWLVCVKGGKPGKDFRLTQETNYIGRAASNDVCLDFDETISRDTTITITYVKQSRVFRLNVEQSKNPVTVNGSPVLTELYLRDRDVISVGGTQLKLVCFCDASFTWEN